MKHTLEQMHLHGFDLNLLQNLDSFQTNQLLGSCLTLFSYVLYPESYCIAGSLYSLFDSIQEPHEVQNLIEDALYSQTNLLVFFITSLNQ